MRYETYQQEEKTLIHDQSNYWVSFNIQLIKVVSWHLSKILQPSLHSRLVSVSLYWMWFKQSLTLMFLWSKLQRNSHHSLLSVLYTTLEICSPKESATIERLMVSALHLRWPLKELFIPSFPLWCKLLGKAITPWDNLELVSLFVLEIFSDFM